MLSKHTFLPTKSLFIAAGIAACGLAAVQQSATALSISLQGGAPSGGSPFSYVYDIGLEAGETINNSPASTLVFNGLDGVQTASFSDGDFTVVSTSTSVTLTSTISGTNTFGLTDLGDLTITSNNAPGTVSWTSTTTGGISTAPISGPVSATLPPPSAAIPFEFSPGLGLILSGTLFGALKLRSKFGKKEEISF